MQKQWLIMWDAMAAELGMSRQQAKNALIKGVFKGRLCEQELWALLKLMTAKEQA